jgi:hypothetical protein
MADTGSCERACGDFLRQDVMIVLLLIVLIVDIVGFDFEKNDTLTMS